MEEENNKEDHLNDEDEEFFKQTSPLSLLNYMKLYGSFDNLRGALAKELEDSVRYPPLAPNSSSLPRIFNICHNFHNSLLASSSSSNPHSLCNKPL